MIRKFEFYTYFVRKVLSIFIHKGDFTNRLSNFIIKNNPATAVWAKSNYLNKEFKGRIKYSELAVLERESERELFHNVFIKLLQDKYNIKCTINFSNKYIYFKVRPGRLSNLDML